MQILKYKRVLILLLTLFCISCIYTILIADYTSTYEFGKATGATIRQVLKLAGITSLLFLPIKKLYNQGI